MNGWFDLGFFWWLALLILFVLGGIADWYSFGLVRRAFRVVANWRRGGRLQRQLEHNPANQKVRLELGDVLVERGAFEAAIAVIKPILEEDPGDLPALLLMGRACLGAGRVEQGELFLCTVESTEPNFRQGLASLELGRFRLARGDAAGAIEALQRYLGLHEASVEGRYLLARALQLKGDEAGARAERERTWREYASALQFQRRAERQWAWRVRPWRPAIYAVLLATALLGAGYLWQQAQGYAQYDDARDDVPQHIQGVEEE